MRTGKFAQKQQKPAYQIASEKSQTFENLAQQNIYFFLVPGKVSK